MAAESSATSEKMSSMGKGARSWVYIILALFFALKGWQDSYVANDISGTIGSMLGAWCGYFLLMAFAVEGTIWAVRLFRKWRNSN